MRAVVQRVSGARVVVKGETVAKIPFGYVVLLGVAVDDDGDDVDFVVRKISGMRLFPAPVDSAGETGKKEFDLSLRDAGGEMLLVSQFTLLADCRKGRRPDWGGAAPAGEAEPLYVSAGDKLRAAGLIVKTGVFAATMAVELVNDGPVTIVLDSRNP